MGVYEEMRYYFECDECGELYDSDTDEAPDGWDVTNLDDGGAEVLCDNCLAEEDAAYDDEYDEEEDD